jgi:hypothetical protein
MISGMGLPRYTFSPSVVLLRVPLQTICPVTPFPIRFMSFIMLVSPVP